MKRCPECHFTFDGDEKFCDFDRAKLIAIPDVAQKPRRTQWSRPALGIAAVFAIAVSALVGGYYDSANRKAPDVIVKTDNSRVTRPIEKVDHAKLEPARKVRFISTQREIDPRKDGASMPSSILKWRKARRSSATLARSSRTTTVKRSTVAHNKTVQANRRAHTARTTPKRNFSNSTAVNTHASSSTLERTRTRVVSLVKKTGSLLSKPFRL